MANSYVSHYQRVVTTRVMSHLRSGVMPQARPRHRFANRSIAIFPEISEVYWKITPVEWFHSSNIFQPLLRVSVNLLVAKSCQIPFVSTFPFLFPMFFPWLTRIGWDHIIHCLLMFIVHHDQPLLLGKIRVSTIDHSSLQNQLSGNDTIEINSELMILKWSWYHTMLKCGSLMVVTCM